MFEEPEILKDIQIDQAKKQMNLQKLYIYIMYIYIYTY